MTVLIPAYEPNMNLLKLIGELQARTSYGILVVDDGSGAGYKHLFDEAAAMGCTVLRHDINRGKGAALKTGFLHLLTAETRDDVVCADSDGQHRVEDIIKVAAAIGASDSEMVLGTREFTGKVPPKSKIGNTITSLIMRAATGIALKDTQTGLRAYPSTLLDWLRTIEGERFEYELNLLLAAKRAGIELRQVTIATIYDDNNKGTHFRPVQDSLRVLTPILKFSGVSMVSGILDFFLLFLFQSLSGSLLVGVVVARLLSSVFNYTMNKHLVFNAHSVRNTQSAPKYFGLVAVIMTLNYLLLSFLTAVIGIPGVPAKLITEIGLFFMSYTVQKLFVFHRGSANHVKIQSQRQQIPLPVGHSRNIH